MVWTEARSGRSRWRPRRSSESEPSKARGGGDSPADAESPSTRLRSLLDLVVTAACTYAASQCDWHAGVGSIPGACRCSRGSMWSASRGMHARATA